MRSNAIGMVKIPIKFIKSICPAIVKPPNLFNIPSENPELKSGYLRASPKEASADENPMIFTG